MSPLFFKLVRPGITATASPAGGFSSAGYCRPEYGQKLSWRCILSTQADFFAGVLLTKVASTKDYLLTAPKLARRFVAT
jgi:hypothetical protein